jgi:hypothetical protein
MRSHVTRSRGVLLGVIGLLALAVSAAVWGITNLGASDPRTTYNPTPSPEKVAEIRDILFADEAVKGILAGRNEGRDYWMRIDTIFEHADVKNTGEPPIAAVQMYFEPPVSWEGEAPTWSDPCSGHYDDDGWLVDKNDPCVNEPREYQTRQYGLTNANNVHAFVDLRVGRVMYVLGGRGASPDEIRYAKNEYATPGSPQQDAQVREILFRHEAVKKMTTGREEGDSFWVGAIGYTYAPDEPLTSDEKTTAMVHVYFDPPLDWSGTLPTQLEPCESEHRQALSRGQPEWPAATDSCWSAPPRYQMQPSEFVDFHAIYADVDLRGGQVLQIVPLSTRPGDLENAKARYGE